MDSTANLGLRLPAGTDYADVADLNYNFAKLDAAMAAARSAGEYAPGRGYAVGDYCTWDGKLYKCTTAIPAGEPWNPAHWAETSVDAEFKALYAALAGKAAVNHTHTAVQVGADPSGSAAAVQANLAAHAGNTTAHLTAAERAAWNGKANTVTLTATVPVAWTASGNFFYQNVSVPGVLATDNPIADILMGGDPEANKLYAEAWGKVLQAITYDGGVQIWCTEAPTVAFPVQFKV
ncbi:carbohydrate-binding protein, partial [Oscillibacter sp.]|uniref:carbohydrate-binding protein n=1 Tax=Oscillibacter sp. TaxID=1945593 RepID=UPI0037C55B90